MTELDDLAWLSHELRSPASGIVGLSDLLYDDLVDVPEHREAVRLIRDNAEHLLGMLDVLLTSIRLKRGLGTPRRESIDLWELACGLVRTWSLAAQRKGLHCRCEALGPIPRHIEGDPLLLRQLLGNLLENAIRYTDEGGVALLLRWHAAAEPPHLDCTVADSGIGMDPDQTSRLFQRYEQVHVGERRGGSGIGLWACAQLAEAMGGELGVRSQPDLGSRFRLRLPLPDAETPSHQPAACEPSAPAPAPAIAAGASVALLSRDPCIRLQVGAPLKRAGSRVHLLDDPQGFAALRDRVRLVFIDIDGPADWARELPLSWRRSQADLSLVGLAEADEVPDRLRYLAQGFDDVLGKPVSHRRLLEIASNLASDED